MKFLGYAAVVLVGLAALFAAVYMVRRMLAACRLRRAATKSGATLIPLKKRWYWDGVKDGGASFFVETADVVYTVKWVGTASKFRLLHFIDCTHYAVRTLLFETHQTAKAATYRVKLKEPYRFDSPVADKPTVPVVMVYPLPLTVSTASEERAQGEYWMRPKRDNGYAMPMHTLHSGEDMGEGTFHTLSSFLKLLAK